MKSTHRIELTKCKVDYNKKQQIFINNMDFLLLQLFRDKQLVTYLWFQVHGFKFFGFKLVKLNQCSKISIKSFSQCIFELF